MHVFVHFILYQLVFIDISLLLLKFRFDFFFTSEQSKIIKNS